MLSRGGGDYTYAQITESFEVYRTSCGLRESDLTTALDRVVNVDALYSPLDCVVVSTPPQEGKTTYLIYYIAWLLIRDPQMSVVYASYNQERANSVSRQIRMLVEQWTPLQYGSASVRRWQTDRGGGLLAAGRSSAVTGFSCDLLVVDDPVKDMQEAQSSLIRSTIVEHFDSVLLTRMSALSHIIIVATRWHKDDLIAHAIKTLDARYVNIPAQAVAADDVLGREPGEWLESVQNRSVEGWERIRSAVGAYVWSALYQGTPVAVGSSYIDVDQIDVIPWNSVVYQDSHGFLSTLDKALVIQSWDLAFSNRGDYVAGQVWALIGTSWIMLDRVHERLTFTQTVSRVQQMAARWPQTSRIYVEQAANGSALIDTLKQHATITPVVPRGSKESRALAVQPLIDSGLVKVVDAAWDPELFQEWRDFPYAQHDDQVDALTQALSQTRTDFYTLGQ